MKKKTIIGLLALGTLGIITLGIGATTVSALTQQQTKVERLSELTGKTISELIHEHFDNGKTFGEIAEENGVLEEFQTNCDGTGNRYHTNTEHNYTPSQQPNYQHLHNQEGYSHNQHRGQNGNHHHNR